MILNKYTVIDAHCHIYPEKIAKLAVNGTDTFYGLNSVYSGTVSDLTDKISLGIDKFVVHSVATSPRQVSSINHFIAKSVQDSGGRFFGLGTLHPESESIEKDIDELVCLNLGGVKLHPDIQKFELDCDKMMRIYSECRKRSLPLLIHTGDYRYDFSNPDRMKKVLDKFPELTVVGAHFGGWSVWEEAANELSSYGNFYVDTSSSFYALSKEKAEDIIHKYGCGKVLFGTDYPMWNTKNELDFLLSLDLEESELTAVLSENAKKVYGF